VGSPTFGKWTSVLLSPKSHNQIYIPVGLARGFLALSDSVQFLYKCGDFYDPKDGYGIFWSDPDLAISWEISNPLVSDADAKYLSQLGYHPFRPWPRPEHSFACSGYANLRRLFRIVFSV